VLITLDTVRADRMGFLGSNRGLTPHLDALARESVVFTRAYSQVPLTTASHATILTGTYPQFHKVDDFQVPLAADLPYAPEILHKQGYRTAAFVGSMVLDPQQGFAHGFERGFDTYDAGFKDWHPPLDRYKTRERRAGEVVARAAAWLSKRPKGPFFLWVHLYDAHYPYDPPPPYKSKYASAPYDGEIAYADSAVGKLLSQLRLLKVYDGSLIAVMADHGEALGDHGEDTHGVFLYDETIHVPLVIKLPSESLHQAKTPGKQLENHVGLVDVLPTILQTLGIDVPKEVQGGSLLGLMKPVSADSTAQGLRDRAAYSETDYPRTAFGWSSLRALRMGKFLYVEAPLRELYDQSTDPNAEHNLGAASAAVASTLASQLDAFRQKTASDRVIAKQALDSQAQARLAALGYIAAGSNDSKTGDKTQSVDPKGKVDVSNKLHQINYLIEALHFQEAIPLLQQLLVQESEMPLPYSQLAHCFLATKKYAEAVPVLRKLVQLNPDPAAPHFELAIALLATNQIPAAVPEIEIAVAKLPEWSDARLMLATAYAQTDREREAVTECEIVLESQPENYGALMLEGRVLMQSKHPDAALAKLEKAAEVQPDAAEPHSIMGDAHEQLGNKAEAAQERAKAKRLAMDGLE
jgi:arylsulfatase A-like enzyme